MRVIAKSNRLQWVKPHRLVQAFSNQFVEAPISNHFRRARWYLNRSVASVGSKATLWVGFRGQPGGPWLGTGVKPLVGVRGSAPRSSWKLGLFLMNEWMNEFRNGMNEWMNEWMNEMILEHEMKCKVKWHESEMKWNQIIGLFSPMKWLWNQFRLGISFFYTLVKIAIQIFLPQRWSKVS